MARVDAMMEIAQHYKLDPNNVGQFWIRQHCAPGHADPNEVCGFCGGTHQQCAEQGSLASQRNGDRGCGGSGLWCRECGRFWSQDVCGESYDTELVCIDGSELTVEDESEVSSWILCSCGARLFKELYSDEIHDESD